MSASPVASTTRFASTASRPDLLSVMTPRIAPSSTIGCTPAVEHRRDARLGDEDVGDVLEPLAVDAHAQRLALGVRRTHRGGALLELAADPVASTVASWRYQPMLSTPTWVMFPPKQP
jgi:hypothetical protein